MLCENPEGGLGEMSCDGSDCGRMPFAAADAFVELRYESSTPVGVMPVADNAIRGLDIGPFQVVVGLFHHPSIAILAAAGPDLGDGAGIAGQMAIGGEAIDAAHFQIDDDAQDIAYAGEGLQQLHRLCELNAFQDPFFQKADVCLDLIQELKLLLHAAMGLWWQEFEELE